MMGPLTFSILSATLRSAPSHDPPVTQDSKGARPGPGWLWEAGGTQGLRAGLLGLSAQLPRGSSGEGQMATSHFFLGFHVLFCFS